MMIKTGIIAAENFSQLTGLPSVWSGWQEVERDGVAYKKITSFDKYFTQEIINQLDFVFDEQEFRVWIESTDVVPTLLISIDFSNKTVTVVEMPSINFKKNNLFIALEIRTYENEVEQKQAHKEMNLELEGSEYDNFINRMNSAEGIENIITDIIQTKIAEGVIN